jgi:hypothetical protein
VQVLQPVVRGRQVDRGDHCLVSWPMYGLTTDGFIYDTPERKIEFSTFISNGHVFQASSLMQLA